MYYLYLKLHDVFTGIQFQRMSGLRDRGREGLTVLWGQRGLQPVPTQPTQVSHLLKPHHCADAVGRGWGGGAQCWMQRTQETWEDRQIYWKFRRK